MLTPMIVIYLSAMILYPHMTIFTYLGAPRSRTPGQPTCARVLARRTLKVSIML